MENYTITCIGGSHDGEQLESAHAGKSPYLTLPDMPPYDSQENAVKDNVSYTEYRIHRLNSSEGLLYLASLSNQSIFEMMQYLVGNYVRMVKELRQAHKE